MLSLVGLPYREDVRGIVGDMIVIPATEAFGATRERLNLTYTEVQGMTLGDVIWYHKYMHDRRTRAQIHKAKQVPGS